MRAVNLELDQLAAVDPKIAYAASSAVAAYLRPCSSQRSGMWVTAFAVTASTFPNRFSRT
jgi:hypothetical protein